MRCFEFRQVRSGDIVDGTIVSVSPTEILVDIRYKADAVVDPRELERLDKDFLASLAVGESGHGLCRRSRKIATATSSSR